MTTHYDGLAARVEQGKLAVKTGTVLHGAAPSAEAQRLLIEATGAESLIDLTRMALGRPALGQKAGPSPVVRARVPQALKDRVAPIAKREQRSKSDVVRDAVAAYVSAQTDHSVPS